MRHNPVDQVVIGAAPVIIDTDADVRIGKVGGERMAVDEQGSGRQCLNQPLPMLVVTLEGELLLGIRHAPVQRSKPRIDNPLPYLLQRIVLKPLDIAEEPRKRIGNRDNPGIQSGGRSEQPVGVPISPPCDFGIDSFLPA